MSFCVCLCVFCLCLLSFRTHFSLIPKMRQVESTPLGLVLNYLKDFLLVAEDSGLVVHLRKLTIFCRNEWPTYKVRWPEEEVLISPSFTGFKAVVYEARGHMTIPGREAPCLDETFFVTSLVTSLPFFL